MVKSFIRCMASLRLTVISLLVLFVLTAWGTLYQAEHGLFQAQLRFYQSWFFLAGGFVPFPGAQLVMSVLFVNLVAAMAPHLFLRPVRWGILTTHLGLLLMLVAGAVTYYLGEASRLTLFEGDSSNVATTDHAWELAVWPLSAGGQRDVAALDLERLREGRARPCPAGGFSVMAEEIHANCQPQVGPDGMTMSGLIGMPARNEPEDNRPGLVLVVQQEGAEAGRLVLWGGRPMTTELTVAGQVYEFAVRPRHLPLPFAVQLLDFRKELHPGSYMAKSFSSQVRVSGGPGPDRKVLISMNRPLRLQGFTFYQSSYLTAPDGREASTFAVVKNHGRLMPYIATGVTVGGLALHFLGQLVLRMQRARRAVSP